MTVNPRGLYGRLFWLANIIRGMLTPTISSQTMVHNIVTSSLEPKIAAKMNLSILCNSLIEDKLSTTNSDLISDFITYLLMGSLLAPIQHNNILTLALFPFVRLMVGGWGNVVWWSRLLEFIWELGLGSYSWFQY